MPPTANAGPTVRWYRIEFHAPLLSKPLVFEVFAAPARVYWVTVVGFKDAGAAHAPPAVALVMGFVQDWIRGLKIQALGPRFPTRGRKRGGGRVEAVADESEQPVKRARLRLGRATFVNSVKRCVSGIVSFIKTASAFGFRSTSLQMEPGFVQPCSAEPLQQIHSSSLNDLHCRSSLPQADVTTDADKEWQRRKKWFDQKWRELDTKTELRIDYEGPRESSKHRALCPEHHSLPSTPLLGRKNDRSRCCPVEEAMAAEVKQVLGRGDPDQLLASGFKLKITRKDICTLCNNCWLNDEVINFYMCLIVERGRGPGQLRAHAFSTFFYLKLQSGGHHAVRQWTKATNLFHQHLILMPVHLGMHWCLAVADLRERAILYLDSLGQSNDAVCRELLQYLDEESQRKRGQTLNSAQWILRSLTANEIPQQRNSSDCGVFVCKYAEYMTRDQPITFTQGDVLHFRRRMVWEILHQTLL
ncbi:uncharacterized protein LOC103191445 isoform X2 [Callorhinchus milii]|uniref:uncharacterized protein LOC103191445 isoform X2 n=1 Tax=Callorhinchus milii TaxID=7868 RepID=UPI001C3F8851|nr:uncharacterized protein LOC103191445 isoform X2 [Callorhinchus milii]